MPPDVPHLLQEATGARYPLKPRTTLGRSPDSDIVLADSGCSNHHAIIRTGPEGWILEDLGSTNGSWVNGEWVQGTHALAAGDLVQLGNLRFRALAMTALPVPPPSAARPGPTVILAPPAKIAAVAPPTPAPHSPEPQGRPGGRRIALIAGLGVLAFGALAATLILLWQRRPASGQPGGAPTTAAEAKAKPALPPKLDLLREAALFRHAASGSALPELVEQHGGDRTLGILTESPVFRKAPAIWSYFFSGTVILGGHMESPKPVVAYYNPYLDAVLLTQWEQVEGKALIRAADLRIASRMAGQATLNPKLAWWVAELSRRPAAAGLKEQYAAFLKAFARNFPVEATTVMTLGTHPDATEARTVIERQALASFANLAHLQNPEAPVHQPGLVALREALRSGDSLLLEKLLPGNNPMTAAALASQPGWVRREAVPIYALAGVKRTIVLLAPTASPRFCLLTAWGVAPASKLESAVPFDLDGGLTPAPRKSSGTGGTP